MKLSEFKEIIKKELQYGVKRVAYMCSIDGYIDGGMCHNESEALLKCKDMFKKYRLEKDNYEFNIVVYNEDVKLLDTQDVIRKIKCEL